MTTLYSSPNVINIKAVKAMRMKRVGQMVHKYRASVGNSSGKTPSQRPRIKWKNA
jgi:hypothetical protein